MNLRKELLSDRIYGQVNDFRGTGLNSKTKKTDIDTENYFFDLSTFLFSGGNFPSSSP